ncbi:hypothetical protein FOZ62_002273, partial [Perkinsus olseni]
VVSDAVDALVVGNRHMRRRSDSTASATEGRCQSSDCGGEHSSFLPLKKRSTRARERLRPSRQQRLQDQVRRLTTDCHKLRRYAGILAETREGNAGQGGSSAVDCVPMTLSLAGGVSSCSVPTAPPLPRGYAQASMQRRVQLVQRRLLREELRKLKEALEEHLAEGHRWADKADMARSREGLKLSRGPCSLTSLGTEHAQAAETASGGGLVLDARHAADSLAIGGVDALNPSAVLVGRYDDQVAAAVAAEERTLSAALACRELQDRIIVLEDWLARNRRPPPSPDSGRLRFDVDEDLVKELLQVRSEELEAVQAKLAGMDSGVEV